MFGYVLLNPRSASEEEKKRYALYYCGLCNALGSSCGKSSTRTLSYDMTFLYILLADLYNQEGTVRKAHCPVHPLTKREYMESPAAAYCADMQILLSYYSAMDKYRDEHSAKALAFMHRHEEKVREIEARYPRQGEAVRTNLAKLADCEAEKSEDAVIAIMAGMAYCINSLPMGWFPSSVAVPFCVIKLFLRLNSRQRYLKFHTRKKLSLSLHYRKCQILWNIHLYLCKN